MKSLKRLLALTIIGGFFFASIYLGGSGGCGSNVSRGVSSGLRSIKGTIAASSLASLKIKGKAQSATCPDIQIGFASASGDITKENVNSDCTFDVPLKLKTFCYGGLFTGEDKDGNGLGDKEVGKLGCAAKGYAGLIPIFAKSGGSTDAIDLGTVTLQGTKAVSANDPCAVVDTDGDGADDATDTDDDGDNVSDLQDGFDSGQCGHIDTIDSDNDGTSDIYESFWAQDFAALKLKNTSASSDDALTQFLTDSDNDDIPDGCDADFSSGSEGCEVSTTDTDGNCIPDEFDYGDNDTDSDGLPASIDCDDEDAASTVECYQGGDYCDLDNDGDGFNLCNDCDDEDAGVTYECLGEQFCSTDEDKDGFDNCHDCNDQNDSVTTECYDADICSQDNDGDGYNLCVDCDDFDDKNTTQCFAEVAECQTDADKDGYNICIDCDDHDDTIKDACYKEAHQEMSSCEVAACQSDFNCQQFADNDTSDAYETADVHEGTCTDGCCLFNK